MNLRAFRDRLLPLGSRRYRLVMLLRNNQRPSAVLRRSLEIAARSVIQLTQRARWFFRDSQAAAAVGVPAVAPGTGPNLVCLPIINWDYRFQRPQQLVTQFVRDGYRAFYLRATFAGFASPVVSVRSISERIYELSLPGDSTLALYRDQLGDPTLRWSARAFSAFIEVNDLDHAICLVHHPFWLPLARWLHRAYGWKIVYDCLDDLSAFEVAHPSILRGERQLAAECALVVASSRTLFDRLSKLNPNCILVPNAADFEHFANAAPRGQSLLADLPRPVVGYYGAIAEWFDVSAVAYAAQQHSSWSFVLIGDTRDAALQQLSNCSNILLMGEKPYADLPGYLASFDVCAIPFLNTPLTRSTNPVKLFEYLSAGKPVVARALPELHPFRDLIELYDTPAQFTSCLQRALETNSPTLVQRRRVVARANTWDRRYQAIKVRLRTLSA